MGEAGPAKTIITLPLVAKSSEKATKKKRRKKAAKKSDEKKITAKAQFQMDAIIIIDIIVVWGVVVLSMSLGMRLFSWPSYILIMFVALDEIISSPFKHMRFGSKKWLENLNYKEVK